MIHSKGKLLLRSAALIALLVAALGILSVLVVHADGTGTIIIEKQTEPPGGAGFEFTDDIEAPNNFTLGHGGTKIFEGVPEGTYTVTETDPAVTPGDYTLTDVECVEETLDGKSWASPSLLKAATRTVTIELPPGKKVTCTFTNRRMPVGGFIVPVSRLGLVAPWLGLAALASLAIVTVSLVRKRRA
jgi:hypothetical protein